jgi:hypothetical protein
MCCAAKVSAWLSCSSTSTAGTLPNAAVSAKRTAVASAAHSSQRYGSKRPKCRPASAKNTISAATETAHISPTAALP